MSPSQAALVLAVGIAGLFLLDRDRAVRVSPALWLPVLWICLGGSRNVSQWLTAGSAMAVTTDQYLEGSPLDRNILSALIVIGLMVLVARGQRTGEVLRRNVPLLVFFVYCLASVVWSDFPFIALKRFTKVLGNVVMVLIVLTELDPAFGVKRFLTRTAYLLIPASILMIKYFPEFGRYWDRWEGHTYYSGVATDKNMLGAVCMIAGLALVSRFFEVLRDTGQRARRFLALGTVFAMTLWLLNLAESATSLGCFLIGGGLIAVLGLYRRPRPWMVHLTVATLSVVMVTALLIPSARAVLLESAGRDSTLTGRTDLWIDVLSLDPQPLLGAGFESFFLGERLEVLWAKYWWHPNESHNGFLETYLTLGIVGLGLLAWLMVSGYRNAMNLYRRDPASGSLRLAFLIIAPIYNMTEAAFKVMNPVWIVFLLAATAPPESQRQEQAQKAPSPVPYQPPVRGAYGRRPAPIVTA
jgi:exopolysaccharide production protein ExoQ